MRGDCKVGSWVGALALMSLVAGAVHAADEPLLGKWHAVDDDSSSGIASIVELYLQGDRLFGRIIKTVDAKGNELHPVCANCPGDLRGKPTKGMQFVWDLRKEGNKWVDGHVIDLRSGPTQGIEASCDLSMADSKAVLHGYIGIRAFGKSSQWSRIPNSEEPPSKLPLREELAK